uniref:Interferon regulatory factor 10 n=1 Tax=Paramormyrops kingsleyae TaxID=1676925 RepID=A0A3B3QZ38_9TELE|nr:interferon regulatory factor 4-like [Paramormyrops kingsleyae]
MEDKRKTMRLREWIIAQIESGMYSGLCWENCEKNTFRIPWKHAAKQDYKQNEDAALFKAWAVYKGKYHEGQDKADPSVWKTRLRCALNKSSDFVEMPERSQLDISEPYKVYKIQTDQDSPGKRVTLGICSPSTTLRALAKCHMECVSPVQAKDRGWEGKTDPACLPQHPAGMDARGASCPWSVLGEPGPAVTRPFVPLSSHEVIHISEFRLRVCLFYQGQMVQDFTTSTPRGCWISHGAVPAEDERVFGLRAAEQLRFPLPEIIRTTGAVCEVMGRLLPHLQRGVRVWVTQDGVFIKRFCQGRVYWGGPLAQHQDRPNKLEREKTCKVLDVYVFLQELRLFLQGAGPKPKFTIDLCFGEEYPESIESKAKKLITAEIEPLFARNMMSSALDLPADMVLQVRDSREHQQRVAEHSGPDLRL